MAASKKNSWVRSPLLIVGAGAVLLAGLSLLRGRGGPADWTEPGARKAASEVEWRVRDGSTWRLSDHRGKVTVVNYFATWCPPCVREMPDLVKVVGETGPRGVTALGISLDEGDPDRVDGFLAKHKVPFPVALGAGDIRVQSIQSIPVTASFDKEGRLAATFTGMVTESELRGVLEKLLGE